MNQTGKTFTQSHDGVRTSYCSLLDDLIMVLQSMKRSAIGHDILDDSKKNYQSLVSFDGNNASVVTRLRSMASTSLDFVICVLTGRWRMVRVTGKQFTAVGLISKCNHRRRSKISFILM